MIKELSLLTSLAIVIVLLLHLVFLIFEMFLWNTTLGRRVFHLKETFARQSCALAANQGLYNGFLAAGLIWGLWKTDGFDILVFFLSCIIIAGLYGGLTTNRNILFIQAVPASLALLLLLTVH